MRQVSYFSNKLKEILDKEGLSQSDLSRTTGLSTAHISNLVNDVQPRVSLEDLEVIAINVSSDDKVRAELIRAHLQDENVGPGSELIDIRISGTNRTGALYDRPTIPPMSPRKERILEIFRRHEHHTNLWNVLDGLGDMMADEPLFSSSPDVQKAEAAALAAAQEEIASYRKPPKKKPAK